MLYAFTGSREALEDICTSKDAECLSLQKESAGWLATQRVIWGSKGQAVALANTHTTSHDPL